MFVVVDDGVEEVRLLGVFYVFYRSVIEEDIFVGFREISVIFYVDDEEFVFGVSFRDRF